MSGNIDFKKSASIRSHGSAFFMLARRCAICDNKKQEGGHMKQYIVDAFTDKPFHGNPAAVLVASAGSRP